MKNRLPLFLCSVLICSVQAQIFPPTMVSPSDDSLPGDVLRSLNDLSIPVVTSRPAMPKVSVERIVKSWNGLIATFRQASGSFGAEENISNDAILMHIQGGILALGLLRPVPGVSAESHAEYLPQLIPNTSALEKYLARKSRENPRVRPFRQLHLYAKELADQIKIVGPVISISGLKNRAAAR